MNRFVDKLGWIAVIGWLAVAIWYSIILLLISAALSAAAWHFLMRTVR